MNKPRDVQAVRHRQSLCILMHQRRWHQTFVALLWPVFTASTHAKSEATGASVTRGLVIGVLSWTTCLDPRPVRPYHLVETGLGHGKTSGPAEGV